VTVRDGRYSERGRRLTPRDSRPTFLAWPTNFDLEVSLREVRPKIWRRFLLTTGATFQQLHDAIQVACDWGDYHLFMFGKRPSWDSKFVIAGIPDDEYGDPAPDARRAKLISYFTPYGPKECFYLYDFGDSWWHRVKLHGIVSVPDRFTRRLLGGKRAFPPEDSGGLPGYAECVAVAATGEDVEERFAWLGEWKPESFDLGAAKAAFDIPRGKTGAATARVEGVLELKAPRARKKR